MSSTRSVLNTVGLGLAASGAFIGFSALTATLQLVLGQMVPVRGVDPPPAAPAPAAAPVPAKAKSARAPAAAAAPAPAAPALTPAPSPAPVRTARGPGDLDRYIAPPPVYTPAASRGPGDLDRLLP